MASKDFFGLADVGRVGVPGAAVEADEHDQRRPGRPLVPVGEGMVPGIPVCLVANVGAELHVPELRLRGVQALVLLTTGRRRPAGHGGRPVGAVTRTWRSRCGFSELGKWRSLGWPRVSEQHSIRRRVPVGSGEKMSGEVGGLDCARFVEQVAGVVQESEMPTVDVVPVLFTWQ